MIATTKGIALPDADTLRSELDQVIVAMEWLAPVLRCNVAVPWLEALKNIVDTPGALEALEDLYHKFVPPIPSPTGL